MPVFHHMPKPNYIIAFAGLLVVAGAGQTAFAQTAPAQTAPAQTVLEQSSGETTAAETLAVKQTFRPRRVKREVQPVPYWIDSQTLRLRDNPVAGRVVGELGYGQRVLAYSQYENWVQISKPSAKPQWVNSDFLSNSRLSWASYNRSGPTRSSDVIAVRIKDPSDRKNRTFGVRLKTAETGNALITTRQNTAQGVFYQNRFVSCDKQKAIGSRLVGEGYSFLDAQNDVRGAELDIYDLDQIEDKINGSLDGAISAFACKAQAF